jgi:hypothetical protein
LLRGASWNTISDLRPGSPSFCAERSAKKRRMMYVPRRFDRGFLTSTPIPRRSISSRRSTNRIASAVCVGPVCDHLPAEPRVISTRTRDTAI